MERTGIVTKFERWAAAAMMVAPLIVLASSSAPAQPAPRPGCVAVTKQEYNNARKSKLQQQRFGEYVRTGRVLRRFYWFCQP